MPDVDPWILSMLPTAGLAAFALLAALAMPFAIVRARNNVRGKRQEIILELERFFTKGKSYHAIEAHGLTRWEVIPSFEFVKSKYAVRIDAASARTPEQRSALDAIAKAEARAVAQEEADGFRWPVIILILLSWAGFFGLFLSVGTLTEADASQGARNLAVVSAGFAGAYLCSLRLLVRSVTNFDLSPITFFRCIYYFVATAMIVLVVSLTVKGMSAVVIPGGAVAADAGSAWMAWLLFGLIAGYVPGLAERYLLALWRYGHVKKLDSASLEMQRVLPVDLIEGVDADIRARLEDFNLFDVQNLATANPIMLFVETPFGIYQSIDWVLQAMLCVAVGPAKFIALRGLSVRTIFDLERAMLPEERERWSRRFEPPIRRAKACFHAPAATNLLTKRVAAIMLALPSLADVTDEDVAAAELQVRIIMDDLAVVRVRQICDTIDDKLNPPWGSPPADCPCRQGESEASPAALADLRLEKVEVE